MGGVGVGVGGLGMDVLAVKDEHFKVGRRDRAR